MAAALKGLNIVVCGSGNGAQAAAGLLASQGHSVNVLLGARYTARAADLAAALAAAGGDITVSSPAGEARGRVAGVTSHAASVTPGADVVVVSLPGPAIPGMLAELAPHLGPHQLVLLLMGTGPANFMALADAVAAAQGPGAPLPVYAAAKTLPWACRLVSPGRVRVGGAKTALTFAVAPGAPALLKAMLPPLLGSLFPGTAFELEDSPLEGVLGIPYGLMLNPIVHPGVMYGTWADWDGTPLPEAPLFYHAATPTAADAIDGLAADARAVVGALCEALGVNFPAGITDPRSTLAGMYRGQVDDDSTTLSLLRTNAAYAGVRHPMAASPAAPGDTGVTGGGLVPDFSSRLLTEDLPCGLVPLRGVAEILGVATPWVDRVITWAQGVMGREYLVGGKLAGRDVASSDAPQRFGARTVEELALTAARPAGGLATAADAAPAPAELAREFWEEPISQTLSVRAPSVGAEGFGTAFALDMPSAERAPHLLPGRLLNKACSVIVASAKRPPGAPVRRLNRSVTLPTLAAAV